MCFLWNEKVVSDIVVCLRYRSCKAPQQKKCVPFTAFEHIAASGTLVVIKGVSARVKNVGENTIAGQCKNVLDVETSTWNRMYRHPCLKPIRTIVAKVR